MITGTGSQIFGVVTAVLVVALALAAIAVIIYGRRLKVQRLNAEKELVERREAAHIDAVVVEPDAPLAETAPATVDPAVTESPAAAKEAEPEALPEPAADIVAAENPAPAPLAEPGPAEAGPAPAPAASPAATEGNITQLKGLGPKLAATLAELGYTRLDQIAALTPEQASALDARLGAFQGRMARDRWIEQARLLVAGDREAYEAAFGKLG